MEGSGGAGALRGRRAGRAHRLRAEAVVWFADVGVGASRFADVRGGVSVTVGLGFDARRDPDLDDAAGQIDRPAVRIAFTLLIAHPFQTALLVFPMARSRVEEFLEDAHCQATRGGGSAFPDLLAPQGPRWAERVVFRSQY